MAQQKDYREVKALSQSSLKLLDHNPRKFYENEYKWLTGEKERPDEPISEAMRMGELVDMLLLTPKEFNDHFVVNDANTPTGQMLDFADCYIAKEKEVTEGYKKEITKEQIRTIAEECYATAGFKRDGIDKVLERFRTEALDYYKVSRLGFGKSVVSLEMMKKAERIVQELKSDEYIGPIVNLNSKDLDITKIAQLPIYHSDYADHTKSTLVSTKGLLDLVVINHSNKTIQPYDLKTTSSNNFQDSFWNWRYDLQASFYNYLLHVYIDSKSELSGYMTMPFMFIVASTIGNPPELWTVSESHIRVGAEGGTSPTGKAISGWSELILDYGWHVKARKWNYPRKVYENDGIRQLF